MLEMCKLQKTSCWLGYDSRFRENPRPCWAIVSYNQNMKQHASFFSNLSSSLVSGLKKKIITTAQYLVEQSRQKDRRWELCSPGFHRQTRYTRENKVYICMYAERRKIQSPIGSFSISLSLGAANSWEKEEVHRGVGSASCSFHLWWSLVSAQDMCCSDKLLLLLLLRAVHDYYYNFIDIPSILLWLLLFFIIVIIRGHICTEETSLYSCLYWMRACASAQGWVTPCKISTAEPRVPHPRKREKEGGIEVGGDFMSALVIIFNKISPRHENDLLSLLLSASLALTHFSPFLLPLKVMCIYYSLYVCGVDISNYIRERLELGRGARCGVGGQLSSLFFRSTVSLVHSNTLINLLC